MAEMALAAFASAGVGTGAGAAGFIGPLTAAQSIGAGIGGFVSSAIPLIGLAGNVIGGFQESGQMKFMEQQSKMKARIDTANAKEDMLDINRKFMSDVSTANAMFASRKLSTGSGTPQQAFTEGAKNASINMEKARLGGDISSSQSILQSKQYKSSASGAIFGGFTKAAGNYALWDEASYTR